MQDLNDKVTGGELTADEWNEVPSEIQAVIESTGITLSGADLQQLGKAIAAYAGAGSFFEDSGAADAYVLGTVGSMLAPPSYLDGYEINFIAGNANTGAAATVNLAGLGNKSLTTRDGNDPAAGAVAGLVTARFSAANDRFELVADISSVYAGASNMYIDSGSANTYTLTAVAEAPTALVDGMEFEFLPTNDNNGASTAAIGSIAAKTIANAGTGFIKTNIRTRLKYRGATDDFVIHNTDRYVSGDAGFEIINGMIRQWGNTGNLGDTSGQPTTTHAFLVPFPASVDEAQVSTIGLTGAVSPASVLSTWDKGGTTLSDISLTHREVTGDAQNNWAIAWVATGQ